MLAQSPSNMIGRRCGGLCMFLCRVLFVGFCKTYRGRTYRGLDRRLGFSFAEDDRLGIFEDYGAIG